MRTMMIGVLSVLSMVPVAAQAQDAGVKGKVSVTLKGGIEPHLSGDVHDGGSGRVLNLPTTVQAKSWRDVYGPAFRGGIGLGYGVTEQLEVIGNATFGRVSADPLQVGTVAGLVLNAQFADYEDLSFEGGLRFNATPDRAVNPYASVVAGVRRVSAIPATFTVPAAGVTLADTPFYDDSTVALFGGDLGVAFTLRPNVTLGAEVGLRWQGSLTDIEGLAGTGLENINDVGQRWSLPVSAVLTFRF